MKQSILEVINIFWLQIPIIFESLLPLCKYMSEWEREGGDLWDLRVLKILQARLQQYVNRELPDVQAGFRKGKGSRDQIANIHWIIEKARKFQKKITSALLTIPKPLTLWTTTNSGKFWKWWDYQTTWPASWETCMQVRKQQLELDMELQTDSR